MEELLAWVVCIETSCQVTNPKVASASLTPLNHFAILPYDLAGGSQLLVFVALWDWEFADLANFEVPGLSPRSENGLRLRLEQVQALTVEVGASSASVVEKQAWML